MWNAKTLNKHLLNSYPYLLKLGLHTHLHTAALQVMCLIQDLNHALDVVSNTLWFPPQFKFSTSLYSHFKPSVRVQIKAVAYTTQPHLTFSQMFRALVLHHVYSTQTCTVNRWKISSGNWGRPVKCPHYAKVSCWIEPFYQEYLQRL